MKSSQEVLDDSSRRLVAYSVSPITPDPLRWTQEFWEHYWSGVDMTLHFGCWPWRRFRLRKGYGQLRHNGKLRRSHQLAWEMSTGLTIPDGLLVCHSCDTPPCSYPPHLFLGTSFDNQSDSAAKGRHKNLGLEQTFSATANHNWRLGEAHPRSKLTEDDVRTIRLKSADGAYMRHLAIEFGVHKETISDVVKGRTWRHVE
jgi:hypothetical protein